MIVKLKKKLTKKKIQVTKRYFNLHSANNIYELLDIDKTNAENIVNKIENHYRSYPIKKSSGKLRWIDAPSSDLKEIQKKILNGLIYQFRAHECAVGFVKRISVKDGAEKHLGNKVILCIDVNNFFGTLSLYQVYAAYGYMLKTLATNRTTFNYTKDDVDILVKLTTYKAHVPQGAPTSPALANIICRQMDRELKTLADKNNLIYTRYADDITFSHKLKTFNIAKILKQTKEILKYYGLSLNKKKTRVLRPHKRMSVTGVVINDKLSTPKYVWRNTRAYLHNLIRDQKSLDTKEYQKLRGKIEWIGLFRPQLKETFLGQLGKVKLTT